MTRGFIMPSIKVEGLHPAGKELLDLILDNGRLRITPPKYTGSLKTAEAYYVWRLVVFYLSPFPAHQLLPKAPQVYLDEYGVGDTYTPKELIELVQAVVDRAPRQRVNPPAMLLYGERMLAVDSFFRLRYPLGWLARDMARQEEARS